MNPFVRMRQPSITGSKDGRIHAAWDGARRERGPKGLVVGNSCRVGIRQVGKMLSEDGL